MALGLGLGLGLGLEPPFPYCPHVSRPGAPFTGLSQGKRAGLRRGPAGYGWGLRRLGHFRCKQLYEGSKVRGGLLFVRGIKLWLLSRECMK